MEVREAIADEVAAHQTSVPAANNSASETDHIPGRPERDTELEDLRRQNTRLRRELEYAQAGYAKYADLYNAAPAGYLMLDRNALIQEINLTTADLLGVVRDQAIGQPFTRYVDPADHLSLYSYLKHLDKAQSPHTCDVTLVRQNGPPFPIQIEGRVVKDDNEAFWQYRLMLSDLSERKRLYEVVEQANREKETILDSQLEHVIYQDREHRILWANQAACQSAQIARQHLIGRYCYEIWPQREEECPDCPIEQAMRTGQLFETEKRTPDGKAWFIRGYPVHDEAGRLIGGIEVTQDISRRVEAEEKLLHAYSELEFRVQERTAQLTRFNEDLRQEIQERRQAEAALRESEEKFRTLADQLPNMILITNQEGVAYVNDRCVELIGYPRAEFYAPDFDLLALFAPEDRSAVQADYARCLQEECLQKPSEYAVITRTGQRLEMMYSVRLINYEGEQAVLGVLTDITEHKQAEAERFRLLAQIQEQLQLLEQILHTVPEGVLLVNTAGQVIMANPVAEQALHQLTGNRLNVPIMHLGDCALSELLVPFPAGSWRDVTTAQPKPAFFKVTTRPLESEITPGVWVMVIRDVTHEREIQTYLRQQEHLAAIGQLAAGIAHDFNNIMAVIVLYTHLLSQNLTADNHRWLTTIDEQAQRAADLTQQILDFSRHAVMEREPLNLTPFLQEQIKLLHRVLPETIQVEFTHDEAEEYIINADVTRLEQIIMNLSLNARDTMAQRGVLRFDLEHIRLDTTSSAPPLPEMKAGDWVCLSVSETGVGIPSHVLPHIFEPFYTTKAPGRGSGLGLAQVYGIVKQHEGYIDVLTEVDQGTTFKLYFPALTDQAVAPSRATSEDLMKGRGETILVVERNLATREALVESLKVLNYQVLQAITGQEAMATLERHHDEIALVLSDAVMPEIDGITLLHTLKHRGLATRLVMLTDYLSERELNMLYAQGMRDWLPKPSSLRQLAEVVARSLQKIR